MRTMACTCYIITYTAFKRQIRCSADSLETTRVILSILVLSTNGRRDNLIITTKRRAQIRSEIYLNIIKTAAQQRDYIRPPVRDRESLCVHCVLPGEPQRFSVDFKWIGERSWSKETLRVSNNLLSKNIHEMYSLITILRREFQKGNPLQTVNPTLISVHT